MSAKREAGRSWRRRNAAPTAGSSRSMTKPTPAASTSSQAKPRVTSTGRPRASASTTALPKFSRTPRSRPEGMTKTSQPAMASRVAVWSK